MVALELTKGETLRCYRFKNYKKVRCLPLEKILSCEKNQKKMSKASDETLACPRATIHNWTKSHTSRNEAVLEYHIGFALE